MPRASFGGAISRRSTRIPGPVGSSGRLRAWARREALMPLKPPPPPSLKPPLSERDHTLGRPDAKITLVEYGDFQCPHCRQAVTVVNELRRRYGDDLLFGFRHF